MKKKALLITMQLFMLFGTIANAEILSGSCGTNANYTLDTESGVLEISGSGNMDDYSLDSSPWSDYFDHIKEVKISGISYIGDFAFSNG